MSTTWTMLGNNKELFFFIHIHNIQSHSKSILCFTNFSWLSWESEGILGTYVCGELLTTPARLNNIIIWCCPKYPEYLQFFIALQLAVPLWLVAATMTQTALSNKDVHVCLWISLSGFLYTQNRVCSAIWGTSSSFLTNSTVSLTWYHKIIWQRVTKSLVKWY